MRKLKQYGSGMIHANYVALSDRDLPRLQTANDAIAATGRFRRY
jgi:hypothetical protein